MKIGSRNDGVRSLNVCGACGENRRRTDGVNTSNEGEGQGLDFRAFWDCSYAS